MPKKKPRVQAGAPPAPECEHAYVAHQVPPVGRVVLVCAKCLHHADPPAR